MFIINANLLHGLRGPDFLQATIPPLWVFSGVELGDGRDVRFELPSKDGCKLLCGCVGFVPRRHPLEIHQVVCRGHGEGPQDTEAEGALGVFGNPTA